MVRPPCTLGDTVHWFPLWLWQIKFYSIQGLTGLTPTHIDEKNPRSSKISLPRNTLDNINHKYLPDAPPPSPPPAPSHDCFRMIIKSNHWQWYPIDNGKIFHANLHSHPPPPNDQYFLRGVISVCSSQASTVFCTPPIALLILLSLLLNIY